MTDECLEGKAERSGRGVPPGTFKSDDEYFLLPSLGLAYPLTERSTVGAAVVGHGPRKLRNRVVSSVLIRFSSVSQTAICC